MPTDEQLHRVRTGVCKVCRAHYIRTRGAPRWGLCSDACRRARAAQRRREARAEWSALAPRRALCHHCGEWFDPARSDARYCGTRCRVAAHRARER